MLTEINSKSTTVLKWHILTVIRIIQKLLRTVTFRTGPATGHKVLKHLCCGIIEYANPACILSVFRHPLQKQEWKTVGQCSRKPNIFYFVRLFSRVTSHRTSRSSSIATTLAGLSSSLQCEYVRLQTRFSSEKLWGCASRRQPKSYLQNVKNKFYKAYILI